MAKIPSVATTIAAPKTKLAPVETFVVGSELPERVAAEAVTVRFRSNAADATFECRVGTSREFNACPDGASYTFKGLSNGQTYTVAIRAKAKDGRLDATPLVVVFLADFTNGEPVPGDGGLDGDGNPVDPSVIPPRPGAGAPNDTRNLMLGAYYQIQVPSAYLVTSYSTTHTFDADLRFVRLMGAHGGNAYRDAPCNKAFERVIAGPDGSQYCDATPTQSELATNYSNAMPFNHVEIVRGAGSTTDERILVAAFDQAETDPNDGRLTIAPTCANAQQSGWAAVPGLEDFFATTQGFASLSWCLVHATDGKWWYVGTFTATRGTARLQIIHSAAANLGITSGQAFAARVGETMQALLEPLAPTH